MPSAFSVANSPVTSSGTLAVTGAGTASQYVRGDGQLANFPDNGGGGSSVNYYLNGSVNQGTFGGDTYYEMSKTPILGAGTNFTRTNGQGNGYIASFITDAGDPSLLNIPGGNWNLEFYFASSASGGSPQFYGEVYKVSSSNVFTLVASGSTNPEGITNGTIVDQYFTSIPVPQTSLLVTDRLAVRIYVITSGRTITLHTEDGNLCEVLTTLSTGLNALNGLTSQVQYFATGTSGTDFAISSATDTHTFNIPTASATNRGALSSADWSTFSGKVGGSGATGQVAYWNGTGSVTGSATLTYTPTTSLLVNNSVTAASAIAKGTNLTPTLTASANNDVLVGLDVNPTFTNGAFTGVRNLVARFNGNISFAGWTLQPNGLDFGYDISTGIYLRNTLNAVGLKAGAGVDGTNRIIVNPDGSTWILGSTVMGGTTNAGFRLDVVGTARVSGNFTAAGNISFPTFSTTGIGVNASGAFYFNLAGAGTGDQNLAIGSNARALGSYGIAINNAQAQAGGIAISYTRADSGDFAAASAITFNGLVPISNVYFGTGKYRQNPDGSFTTGAGADYAINGSGASGTNLAGGTITIAGGKGTGSGASGDVVISTATTTTSGTTLQTLTPRLEVFGNTGNVLIQSGGTFTDAGFKLDVNGTARVSGNVIFGGQIGAIGATFQIKQSDATIALQNTGTGNFSGFNLYNDAATLLFSFQAGGTTSGIYAGNVLFGTRTTNGKILFVQGNGPTSIGTWFSTGNLLIGSGSTDAGFKIDVEGTGRVSGDLKIGNDTTGILLRATGGMLISRNGLAITNGNDADVNMTAGSGALGICELFVGTSTTRPLCLNKNGNEVIIGQSTATTNASSILTLVSTTKGFLPPRMTTTQKNAIGTPAAGLIVYDTDTNKLCCYNGSTWNDLF
jgi:hypothetical protein